jgi:hypothetical protein
MRGTGSNMATDGKDHVVKVTKLDGTFVGYLTDDGRMPQKSNAQVIRMDKARAERQAFMIEQYGKFKAVAAKLWR